MLFPLRALLPRPFSVGLAYGAVAALHWVFAARRFSYRTSLVPADLRGRVNSSRRPLV